MTKIGKVQVDPSITPDSIPDRVFLRPREIAVSLGVSLKTVYRWCKAGNLVAIKARKSVYILRESVIALIRDVSRPA